jgi:hypothetical protein
MAISTIGQNGLNAPLSLTTPNLGTPSAINLSNATAVPAAQITGARAIPASTVPAGSVIQVVSTFNTNTVGITTATSLVPLSITLSSTSSKVLVCASMSAERVNGTQGGSYIYVHIRRNTTILGNSGSVFNALGYQTNVNSRQGGSIQYLDSPASTSALSYDIYQDFATSGGAQFNFYGLNLTLMEIAG